MGWFPKLFGKSSEPMDDPNRVWTRCENCGCATEFDRAGLRRLLVKKLLISSLFLFGCLFISCRKQPNAQIDSNEVANDSEVRLQEPNIGSDANLPAPHYSWLSVKLDNPDHLVEIQANQKPFAKYKPGEGHSVQSAGADWHEQPFAYNLGDNTIMVRYTLAEGHDPENYCWLLLALGCAKGSSDSVWLNNIDEPEDFGYAECRIDFTLSRDSVEDIGSRFTSYKDVDKKEPLFQSFSTGAPQSSGPLTETVKKWYDNGTQMLHEEHKDGKLINGTYFNKDSQQVCEVKNGTGGQRDYYRTGEVSFVCPIVDSNWHGNVTNYYPSNQVHAIRPCTHGKLNGEFLEYYENGKINIRGPYKHDNKEGKWIRYDESGKTLAMVTFSNNRAIDFDDCPKTAPDGEWVRHYEDGKVHVQGCYKHGKKEGKWVKYDRDGKILATAYFMLDFVTDFSGR